MTDELTEHLRQVYHISGFRPMQKEIISALIEGGSVAAFLPTGVGKTLLYQFPTTFLKLKTVVLSPLIALIADQARRAESLKIPVFELHGLKTPGENQKELAAFLASEYGILILSPERWNSGLRDVISGMGQAILLVIDEAHCISTWGKSFRPSYREMTYPFEENPDSRFLVLSATPAPDLIDLVKDQFNPPDLRIFTGDLYRYNLVYATRVVPSAAGFLESVFPKMTGPAILYLQNRSGTERLASHFTEKKMQVSWFHAGLPAEAKKFQSSSFMTGKTNLMFATSAFGMGIDKADIRYIFHLDFPETIADYLQETGRAGRDGQKSWIYLVVEEEQVFWLRKSIEEIRDFLKIPTTERFEDPAFRSPYLRRFFKTELIKNMKEWVNESDFLPYPLEISVRLTADQPVNEPELPSGLTLPEILLHLGTGRIRLEPVKIRLNQVSQVTGCTEQEVFLHLIRMEAEGKLVFSEKSPGLPFRFPVRWKNTGAPAHLAAVLKKKLEDLVFWDTYIKGSACLMALLVQSLGAGAADYRCGQCSWCLSHGGSEPQIEDLDRLIRILQDSGPMPYRDLLTRLSGSWMNTGEEILPKTRLDQVIRYAEREGLISETRFQDGSEINLTER